MKMTMFEGDEPPSSSMKLREVARDHITSESLLQSSEIRVEWEADIFQPTTKAGEGNGRRQRWLPSSAFFVGLLMAEVQTMFNVKV
jgi:hypothetical protein